jgi:hypothetical protein
MQSQASSAGTAPWRPSGVVTLTTDFGQRDTFVGVMKGVLLGAAPRATPVDLTHEVPPQDVRAAAFHLRHAWSWFGAGAVHVAVVDPGVGSARRILLALQDGHAFLAPDNGLLSGVLGAGAEVRALDVERVALPRPSRTFHGRDVFMPAAARLAAGEPPAALAPHEVTPLCLEWPGARELPAGGFEAPVEVVDHFGNAITALTGAQLDPERARGWVARVAGRELPLAGTYAEVPSGQALALLDSFGRWEVAVRDGDAARTLGLVRGERVEFLPPQAAQAGQAGQAGA